MDISQAIKTGYFQALSPEIGIPVYDAFSVPESASYPYVIIASIVPSEKLPNGCLIYNCVVTLDVVTGFSSPKGMNEAWNISEDIRNIVRPRNGANLDLSSYGWNIGETRGLPDNPVQLRTGNYWIYRNILVFSHIVYPVSGSS